jgi:hypothetical protein
MGYNKIMDNILPRRRKLKKDGFKDFLLVIASHVYESATLNVACADESGQLIDSYVIPLKREKEGVIFGDKENRDLWISRLEESISNSMFVGLVLGSDLNLVNNGFTAAEIRGYKISRSNDIVMVTNVPKQLLSKGIHIENKAVVYCDDYEEAN